MTTATSDNSFLDRLLDPVRRCLNRDAAAALVELRANDEAQARLDWLAEQNSEGTLSASDRADYEALVGVANVITVLQSKARAILRNADR